MATTTINQTKNEPMTGVVDGNNKQFSTSRAFVPGTFKPVINGAVYNDPTDDEFGFTEIDNNTIEFNNAPQSGDTVACSYEYEAIIDIDIDALGVWRGKSNKPTE